MNTEELETLALNQCVDIANDFTEQEVRKFFPLSVQKAWEIGNKFLILEMKRSKERRKRFVI